MPIQIDIRKAPFYKWGKEEGLKEGKQEGLKEAILLRDSNQVWQIKGKRGKKSFGKSR
jgi:predicted transposase YdaD